MAEKCIEDDGEEGMENNNQFEGIDEMTPEQLEELHKLQQIQMNQYLENEQNHENEQEKEKIYNINNY